jgi:photosystem II stability/assembly factor-like uncharacterized protein
MRIRPWKAAAVLAVLGGSLAIVAGCSDKKTLSPNTPIISLSHTTLVYASYAGSVPNPAAQRVTVTNAGVGTMSYSVTTDSPWIELGPITDVDFLVTIRSEELAVGSYEDTVTVTSMQAANSPVHIRVLLTVTGQLAVSSTWLGYTALSGGDNPEARAVQVSALGGTEVAYSATSTSAWIVLDSASGTTPGNVVIGIDVSTQSGGIYYDSVVVTSPDLPDSRLKILVRLAVSSWSEQMPGGGDLAFVLRGVTFVDALHGWASGYLPHAAWPSAVVCRTEDGGGTWEILSDHMPTGAYEGVAFTDINSGWIAGDSGRLIHTIDGGDHWTTVDDLPIDSNVSLVNLIFTSPDSGWIVGSHGTILATTDSGDTWLLQSTPLNDNLADLWYLNSQESWVCGNHGAILHTSNGGTTWTAQTAASTTDLRGICFVDASHGWAVGEIGTMIRTTNGGVTWTALPKVTDKLLLDVFFVSATHGWAVGFGGLILQTTDGGDTWDQQPSGTDQAIFDIFFIDENIGVVVGESGIIMRTLSAGY